VTAVAAVLVALSVRVLALVGPVRFMVGIAAASGYGSPYNPQGQCKAQEHCAQGMEEITHRTEFYPVSPVIRFGLQILDEPVVHRDDSFVRDLEVAHRVAGCVPCQANLQRNVTEVLNLNLNIVHHR
jgi:hypothetical protein